MRKNFPALFISILLLVISAAQAQQTNFNEDYFSYLPEGRAFNKQFAQRPAPASLLTSLCKKEQLPYYPTGSSSNG